MLPVTQRIPSSLQHHSTEIYNAEYSLGYF